ncbi:MAG: hypothetical protein KBA96_04925 [Rhodocyclaceae bacterium]|nr:hypothetical protein [Rhodocyclaceae bacterium]MBP7080433.1 hypothetical protein [Rhodocyclaceae bacterium]
MWKLIVGFVAFAGLALWVLMNSGPVDIGGEHAAQEAMHKSAPPAPAAAPTGATTAPAGAATKP